MFRARQALLFFARVMTAVTRFPEAVRCGKLVEAMPPGRALFAANSSRPPWNNLMLTPNEAGWRARPTLAAKQCQPVGLYPSACRGHTGKGNKRRSGLAPCAPFTADRQDGGGAFSCDRDKKAPPKRGLVTSRETPP
jgi:hypothetical protein